MTHPHARRGKSITEAEFRRLWADPKLTTIEIGARLGISHQAVAARARNRGLPRREEMLAMRRRGPASKVCDATLRRLWLAGVARSEIAQHMGTTESAVADARKRLGLPARPHGGAASTISLAEYLQQQLARRLAAVAHDTREAMLGRDMVDKRVQMWGAAA